MVPSAPSATPRGSPGRAHRRTTLRSRVGDGFNASLPVWARAAPAVSRIRRAVKLLLECVGEFFDDCVREEPLTHLSKLGFDVLPCLPTVRKRDPKQFAGPHIF